MIRARAERGLLGIKGLGPGYIGFRIWLYGGWKALCLRFRKLLLEIRAPLARAEGNASDRASKTKMGRANMEVSQDKVFVVEASSDFVESLQFREAAP